MKSIMETPTLAFEENSGSLELFSSGRQTLFGNYTFNVLQLTFVASRPL